MDSAGRLYPGGRNPPSLGKGIDQLNSTRHGVTRDWHLCGPHVPFVFPFLLTQPPSSSLSQAQRLPTRGMRRAEGWSALRARFVRDEENLIRRGLTDQLFTGHLSPPAGFPLTISTDVTQNSGCVLWTFPGVGQSVTCKMAGSDSSPLTQPRQPLHDLTLDRLPYRTGFRRDQYGLDCSPSRVWK